MGKLEADKTRMTLERDGAAIVIENLAFTGRTLFILPALERDGAAIVIENIPALVCAVCQEEYFDENITGQVLEFAEKVFETGLQTSLVTFDMPNS